MRIAAALLMVTLVGCAGARQRGQLEDGLLTVGMIQETFLSVWGNPDRTTTQAGVDGMGANWNGGGFEFSKGKRILEVWRYESRAADLVFDRKRLVAWHTDKTTQELASP